MKIQDRLANLIFITEKKCMEWICENERKQLEFVDPIDRVEISAHYGATHMAAALLLDGKEKLGKELLKSILERWNSNVSLPSFHNDFNNFALCVIYELVDDDLKNNIKEIVLETPDSNHDTINWLPMRWYVNNRRYNWTGDNKYFKTCEECKKKIEKATWSDGFIDDRLPKGLSFNLQYNVATVAIMQFLHVCGEDIDLSKELGALLAAEAIDGDINYFGRGTNQIFAWGLWIYLLASSNQSEVLTRAISYLEKTLPACLDNNNIMLNDFLGKEKYMWWDYHYCSVYTAHLLFWLILAQRHMGNKSIVPLEHKNGNSGLVIYKNESLFAVTFEGRIEYLAEKGPVLCALGTYRQGMLLKGAFGPWQGAFGNNYIAYDTTLKNFAGIIMVDVNKDYSSNRILKKFRVFHNSTFYEIIQPAFCRMDVSLKERELEITYAIPKDKKLIFNIPIIMTSNFDISSFAVCVDGKFSKLHLNQILMSQYGWCRVFQTNKTVGRMIKINLKG